MNNIAKKLLEINAVFIRPNDFFTFTSGNKSPIYIDNRITLSYPKVRSLIADKMSEVIKKEFPNADFIMSVATAGIFHGALISERLGLPSGYVRSSAKIHGRSNKIEGKLEKSNKVIIIEDLITTGGSVLEAVKAVEDENAEVLGVVVIFNYQIPKTQDKFKDLNLPVFSLTNFDSVISTAISEEYISVEDKKIIDDWKQEFDNK